MGWMQEPGSPRDPPGPPGTHHTPPRDPLDPSGTPQTPRWAGSGAGQGLAISITALCRGPGYGQGMLPRQPLGEQLRVMRAVSGGVIQPFGVSKTIYFIVFVGKVVEKLPSESICKILIQTKLQFTAGKSSTQSCCPRLHVTKLCLAPWVKLILSLHGQRP